MEQKDLINAADQAMYMAKHLGGNQVRTAYDPTILSSEHDT